MCRKRGFEIVSTYMGKGIRIPKRSTLHSAGYDIEAAESMQIQPGQTVVCPTGLKAFMGPREVLQVYPRSSLAKNRNLVLLNSVGIIDSDYYNNPDNEGHIGVMLLNIGTQPVSITKGERIVQGIFVRYLRVTKDSPREKSRVGGIGSTGI